MVKKTATRNTTNHGASTSLAYVMNEELLDEILGEYDPPRGGKKRPTKQQIAPASKENTKMEIV